MGAITIGACAGQNPRQAASTAPIVVVMPGCERFVYEHGGSPARARISRFANGELRMRVSRPVEGRRCVVVGSLSPPAGNLERLTLVTHALRRAGASRVTALLPYLAYARQDRAARTESLGLAWVGGLLRASGVNEVVCVDVHSRRAAEVLGLGLASLSPAKLIASALPTAWRSQVSFVAPDRGAVDRTVSVARAVGADPSVVWARKRRTATGVEHLGFVGSPKNRAVIVDDILDTGDTLVSCCRALRGDGVAEIAVIATHGLFTGTRWEALLAEGVREMWVTDTVLARHRPRQAHIVSVAPLLASVLDGAQDPGGS